MSNVNKIDINEFSIDKNDSNNNRIKHIKPPL